jgi:putative FmdB family regulatory protein
MPIYEYECLQCGKRTELLQRMDGAPLAACPQCGGPVKKLISSPAFQFKGSGWYATDYAGKKGAGAETQSEDKGGEGGSKADKKEEKKEKKEVVAEAKSSSGSGSSGSSDS